MVTTLLLLLLISLSFWSGFTFSPSSFKPTTHTLPRIQCFNLNTRLYAKLNFHGSKTFHTKELPIGSLKTLRNLFDQSLQDLAKIALGGSGDDNVIIIPKSESAMKKWTNAAKNVNASIPSEDGFICKVKTGGLNFSGLKVISIANIGAQIIKNDDVTKILLEFTYIDDEKIVEGPSFLVYIFNTLTGVGSKKTNGNETSGQSVQSLSRLYVTVSNQTVVFHIDAKLDISMTFPSILLKLLPVSKQKAEEQGSQAIMKSLIKDTEAMIQKLERFYQSLQ